MHKYVFIKPFDNMTTGKNITVEFPHKAVIFNLPNAQQYNEVSYVVVTTNYKIILSHSINIILQLLGIML